MLSEKWWAWQSPTTVAFYLHGVIYSEKTPTYSTLQPSRGWGEAKDIICSVEIKKGCQIDNLF